MRTRTSERALAHAAADPRDAGETEDGDLAVADAGRQFVTALARGLDVLKAFSSGEVALGNQELAERTGLAKPTVSRLCFTLMQLGYLSASEHGSKYKLGTAALSLGYWAMANVYVRQVAKPAMQKLSTELNVCCALGYADGTDAVYLEHTRGAGPLVLGLESGSRTPISTTAMGRALVVLTDPDDRARLARQLEKLSPSGWPVIARGLEESQKLYDAHGFVLSMGEWEKEIHAVGVPLRLGGLQQPMALMLGGPAYRFTREDMLTDVGPRLVAAAREVEASLSVRSR